MTHFHALFLAFQQFLEDLGQNRFFLLSSNTTIETPPHVNASVVLQIWT
jgi:hypothetical protein